MKLTANGSPLCVPLEDKKLPAFANLQARNNPVASKNAYVKYMMALLPWDDSSAMRVRGNSKRISGVG